MRSSTSLVIALLTLLTFVITSASACGGTSYYTPRSDMPGPTTADCAWVHTVHAWLDLDENGERDTDELPLAGVLIHVDDILNGFDDVADYAVTNVEGDASLYVWLPGCPDYTFEIYAETPAGYRLTTPERVAAHEPIEFGLTYLPDMTTATPRPSAPLACTSYSLPDDLEYHLVQYLLAAPDGAIWGEARGLFQYDWRTDRWNTYKVSGDSVPYIEAMAMAADGVLWISILEQGVTRFDGKTWTRYGVEDGLLHNRVADIAIAADNSAWLVSYNGASHLMPDTGEIRSYPFHPENSNDYLERGTITPDGTFWAIATNGMFELPLSAQTATTGEWVSHNYYPDWGPPDFSPISRDGIRVSPAGILWLSGVSTHYITESQTMHRGGYGLASFDPLTEEWMEYSYATTRGALLGDHIVDFVVAADGSVWLITDRTGVAHLWPAESQTAAEPQVHYYSVPALEGQYMLSIALAPDGAIWIGVQGSILRCVP